MTENEIYAAIKEKFPEAVIAIKEGKPPEAVPLKVGKDVVKVERKAPLGAGAACYGWVEVRPEAMPAIAAFIKTAPGIELDMPHSVSGVDYKAGDPLGVSYHFTSVRNKHWCCIKVTVPRDNPVVPSIFATYPGVDWHEREAFDLVGIRFEGHPNMRRILCAEDWEGHPLRKDYKFPDSYHGIPTGKEVRWNS